MAKPKLVFVFPGQGSQYPGMGRDLHDGSEPARRRFATADGALDGLSISELCFSGSDASLALTENTQPCILTVSAAVTEALGERGIRAEAVAGHSLGEYSALVAAGALDLADAVRLVRNRGRYMQEAVPVGVGAMAAIIGIDADTVAELCREAARGDVLVPANYNAPGQTVVAGAADAVRRAVALAEARGARRAVMLPVSAPFHSPLMAPARERLAADLERTEFRDPEIPVVCNVDAGYIKSAADARDRLARQVTSPVRWTECVERLLDDGATTFVEAGPGRVLLGLVRRIRRDVGLHRVEDLKTLEATVAALGGDA